MTPLKQGRAGQLYEITDPTKNTAATVEAWLLHLPGAHPLWAWFLLYVIHLRDEEGLPLAEKIKPEFTHQLVFAALDPVIKPEVSNFKTMIRLSPSNYIEQFTISSDEKAELLAYGIAAALVDGQLIAEPDGIMGAREMLTSHVSRLSELIEKGFQNQGKL